MKFPYIKTPTNDPNQKWVSRPLIPITIFGPRGSIYLDALVDSGADQSLFHSDIGRAIGLAIETGERKIFGGIEGGQVLTYLHPIDLQIIGIEQKIKVVVGFAETSGISAILGQEGFFDNFYIKFERSRHSVEINPVKKR